jgi:hypothetical protein
VVSAEYYREQARLLKEWAARADADTAARLLSRASDYLTLAQLLDDTSPARPPPPLDQPSVQQQQQIQPKNGDKNEDDKNR